MEFYLLATIALLAALIIGLHQFKRRIILKVARAQTHEFRKIAGTIVQTTIMERQRRLTHLLNSNDIPSTIDAESARQIIDSLSASISELQSQLAVLEEKRREHRAILSSVRRMPFELLGEIFVLVVVPNMGALDKYERQVVLDLGLVCKGWRDATLYTHRLWCAITISSTDRLSGHQKATKWLERSRSMPKTIEYHSLWNRCECSGGQMCHSTNPLLIKLLSEGPLLHHFELQVARRECFKNWIAAMGATKKTHSFPRPWDSLRSFELTFDNEEHDRWDQLEEPAQSIFNILPPVTSLSIHLPPADNAFPNLSGTETDSRYGVLDIPRDLLIGLTTLTLSCDWKGTRLLAILQHCTNVETLSLDFNLQRFPFMHERDYPFSKALANCPILLPKTHTLRLSQAGTAEVLKYLQAPSLTHLHLEFSGSEIQITDFENTIPRFLRVSRATGSLLTLHISNASISGAHLRQSLSGLRSLKLLSLDHVELRDTLFIRSPLGDAIHPHLPSVEHFKLLELNNDYKSIGVSCLDERRGCTPCIMTVSFQKKHSDYEYIQHYASLFLWKENASITLLTIPPI